MLMLIQDGELLARSHFRYRTGTQMSAGPCVVLGTHSQSASTRSSMSATNWPNLAPATQNIPALFSIFSKCTEAMTICDAADNHATQSNHSNPPHAASRPDMPTADKCISVYAFLVHTANDCHSAALRLCPPLPSLALATQDICIGTTSRAWH
jgi:hypothetical protein